MSVVIKELRLLPPLAFARFGSADEPLENYALSPDPLSAMADGESLHNQPDAAPADGDLLGCRTITPAETLIVDKQTATKIASVKP